MQTGCEQRSCLLITSPQPFSRTVSRRVRRQATRASKRQAGKQEQQRQQAQRQSGGLGDVLGPIGLTLGGTLGAKEAAPDAHREQQQQQQQTGSRSAPTETSGSSIASVSTEEWRRRHERDGCVDLWVEEEFNAGSRLMGGRTAHHDGAWGVGSGEGPSRGRVPVHTVKIHNRHADQYMEVQVPQDRYVLWEAEDQGLLLPYACRMGCCTACAVRVRSGTLAQTEALGVSADLRARGFGLMCVGFPESDLELETVDEDEVYDLQFGQAFQQQAVDPRNKAHIERDDFALEVANMDE